MRRIVAAVVLVALLLAVGAWLLLGAGGSGGDVSAGAGGASARVAGKGEALPAPRLEGVASTHTGNGGKGESPPEEPTSESAEERTVAVAGRVITVPGVSFDELYVHISNAKGRDLEGGPGNEVLSSSGEFRFEGIPEGMQVRVVVHPVRAERRGFLHAQARDVPAGTEDVLIVLRPAGMIRGTVVEASGRPRPHADVRAYDVKGVEQDTFLAYAECDDAGAFQIGPLPKGPVLLVANRPLGSGTSAPLRTEAPAEDVRVVLAAGRPISGQVVGDGDLTRFQVWVWRTDFGPHDAAAERAAADGTFTIDGVGATGRWMVAARAPEEDRCALAGPLEPGTSGVRLTLEDVPALEGTVVTWDGGAIEKHTRVSLHSPFLEDSAHADAQGRWRFRGLPAGRYSLRIFPDDLDYGVVDEKDVDSGRSGVRLVLPRADPDAPRERCVK